MFVQHFTNDNNQINRRYLHLVMVKSFTSLQPLLNLVNTINHILTPYVYVCIRMTYQNKFLRNNNDDNNRNFEVFKDEIKYQHFFDVLLSLNIIFDIFPLFFFASFCKKRKIFCNTQMSYIFI